MIRIWESYLLGIYLKILYHERIPTLINKGSLIL